MGTGKRVLSDEAFRGAGMRRDLVGRYFTYAGLRSTFRAIPTISIGTHGSLVEIVLPLPWRECGEAWIQG
jgi:hypothetical protein